MTPSLRRPELAEIAMVRSVATLARAWAMGWSEENVRTSGVYLCVGRSDAVVAGWGSFAIDRRAFFTIRITLSGPERPTLPEGIGLYTSQDEGNG